jgi:dTDP-4-amino-4,6-dideoxygalactose transaminase
MVKKQNVLFNNLKRPKVRSKKLTKAFNRVLSSGYFILGKEVNSFEKEFAKYLGAKYCIGVGNGQEALQISLMSLGIGKDDEVITTPISAFATTLAILAVGATPVFVDTDQNGLIDLNLIEEKTTKHTKAILPVHLFGNCVDMERLKFICKKNRLFLIEDACQGHGSSFKGKKLGTFGDINCFSFYPTKNLGGFGDGGAIVTNNSRLVKVCREIRDYGQSKKYFHTRYGLNSRLDEIQAAFLREELKYLEVDNKKRKKIAERYFKNLKNWEFVKYSEESNLHLLLIKSKKRDKLQKCLESLGIQTAIHYPLTIPDQPFLKKDFGKVNIPVARKFVKEIISLPFYPEISIKEVDTVSEAIMRQPS